MSSETPTKRTEMDPLKFLILCITNTKDGSKLNVDFDKVAEIMELKSGTAAYWRYKRLVDKETKGTATKDAGAATTDANGKKGKGKGGAGRKKRAASEAKDELVAKKVKSEVQDEDDA